MFTLMSVGGGNETGCCFLGIPWSDGSGFEECRNVEYRHRKKDFGSIKIANLLCGVLSKP